MLDELNRRLAEAADRIRALSLDGGPIESGRIEAARRRIDSMGDLAGLLTDRERLLALRDAEEALMDRLGRVPQATLLEEAVGLAARFRPELSCGLRIAGAVVASVGWEDAFRAWHDGPGIGPRRCPLLTVGGATALVRVDRVASAVSWPEWRAVCLANGRRSAAGLAVSGGRAAVLVYSRNSEMTHAELEAARRIARVVTLVLESVPPVGPAR